MKQFVFLVNFTVMGFLAGQADAGLLVSVSDPAVVWDRQVNPASSPFVMLEISLDGLPLTPDELQAFNLGLKFTGGTGTLEISNVTYPNSDPIFPTFAAPDPTVNEFGGITAIPGDNAAFEDIDPGIGGRNAVTFNFTSADALGVFTLVLDQEFSSYFNAAEIDEYKFTNASLSDGILGTITVTNGVAAVPEPGTLALGLMVAAAGGIGHRHRRKKVLAHA